MATKKSAKKTNKAQQKKSPTKMPSTVSRQKPGIVIQKSLRQVTTYVRRRATATSRRIRGIPDSLRALPTKVKNWRKADKKKKKYRSFRLQKRIKPEPRYVPTAKELSKQTLLFVARNFRLLFGIGLVHGGLYALLVRTTATVDISSLQNSVEDIFGSSAGSVSGTAALLGTVLGSPRNVEGGSFAVTFLVITASLVYVWAIRERMNNVTIRVRDAVFNGLGPLASAFIVLLFMGMQLIPFGIATFFYTSARANSLFASGFEDLIFFAITFFTGLLSFYFLTSSIIGLYAAALPGVYPMRALKAAKELVSFRRLAVFRRIMALAIGIALVYLVLLLIVIRFIPARTYTFIDIFQIAIVPFINVYLYKLYRSLL